MHCVTHIDLLCHCRFDIEEYPYLCMAYKIPPGLNVVVPIKLKVDSNSYRWYDIPITGPGKLTFSEEIADDDQYVLCVFS